MSKTDQLIDCFVEKFNSSPREPLLGYELPPALRLGPPDPYGDDDWKIQRWDALA